MKRGQHSVKRSGQIGKKVMRFRPSLFWDVNPKTIDPKKHARYIIERVMDFGTDKEVQWMWNYYPRTVLQNVARSSRVVHPQTRVLWRVLVRE